MTESTAGLDQFARRQAEIQRDEPHDIVTGELVTDRCYVCDNPPTDANCYSCQGDG